MAKSETLNKQIYTNKLGKNCAFLRIVYFWANRIFYAPVSIYYVLPDKDIINQINCDNYGKLKVGCTGCTLQTDRLIKCYYSKIYSKG